MRRLRCAVLALAAIGSLGAAPADPVKPTSRWVVDYDDAQCVAWRNYGTEAKPLTLALKPSPNRSIMRVVLMREGFASEAAQRPASVGFDGKSVAANALVYDDRRAKRYIASINLPMVTFVANRRAASIAIDAGSFDERLAVPGFAGVMAAFDDCLANLRDVWNVGEPFATRVSQPARAIRPLRDLFKSTTYPSQAVSEGNTGMVGLAMLIDETGKVRDCMVEQTSGFATLDTMSCFVIVNQARFEPAVGADGKPVKSASFQRISWRIGY